MRNPCVWMRCAPATFASPRLSPFGHQGQQDTLAQTSIGDPDAIAGPELLHRLKYSGTSQHQIRPIRADARLCRALSGRQCEQRRRRRVALLPRHPDAINAIAIIARQSQMHSGQAGDRPGCTHHVRAIGVKNWLHQVGSAKGCDLVFDVIHHLAVPAIGRDIAFGKAFRKRDNADRHGQPGSHWWWRGRLSGLEIYPRQFRGPAPDIHNQRSILAVVEQVQAAGD